jgi:uncharacterized spore protein YtfJ
MSQPTMSTSSHRGNGSPLSGLTDRISSHLSVETVYGAPVERDGVTVIPVAVARLAFGGGGGTDPSKHQEGEGAGMAGMVAPTGYIELKDGRTRFVPVVRPARMFGMALAAALAALAILRPQPSMRWPRVAGAAAKALLRR